MMRRALLALLPGAALAACSSGGATTPAATTGSTVTTSTAGAGGAGGGVQAITTVRVHYPAGAHGVSLRGSRAPLEWEHGVPMVRGADDTFTLELRGLAKPLECKPLLDDQAWSLGPNYVVAPGSAVDLWPRFSRAAGEVRTIEGFASAILGNSRAIRVYVPPTYLENGAFRPPVVYMHDGQNLFDPETSYAGVTWRVAETMDAAALDGSIAEALVVGVDNTDDREDEYTPWADPTWKTGGKGELYVRMLVEELRPRIEAEFRVRTGPESTAILGSSLGGVISAWAGVARADVFGLVGAMSPTTWWDDRALVKAVATIPSRPARALRVYVDSGDAGTLDGEPPDDDVVDTAALAEAYRKAGYAEGSTLKYVVDHGGTHDEAHWAARLPGALAFLLGPR
jgi:predicted alpha/beta superfamily hydrolase